MFFVGSAVLNLTAFRRTEYGYRRFVYHIAIVVNALLILAALDEWKSWFERPAFHAPPYESIILGLSGALNQCVLLWAQLMLAKGPKFSLRQLAGAFVYVSLFCAGVSTILRPGLLLHYQEQLPAAEHFQRLGATVKWRDWQLAELYLRACYLNDDDLRLIARLPKISVIELSGTNITDAGLERIGDCKELIYLGLEKTAVTDAGLVNLKNMSQLRFLFLNETSVTDRGLHQLTHLKHLVVLRLEGTQVTKEGIDWLHTQLPNCSIRGTPGGEDYEVGT